MNDTFVQQVQSADLVVLSKVDVADPAPMRDRVAWVGAGRRASSRPCNGDLPEGLFFPQGPRLGREPAHRPHHHENFESEELVIPGGQTVADVELQLEGLRALRVKGFVDTAEGPRVVQGVGRRIELTAPGALKIDPRLIGRVVVIRLGTRAPFSRKITRGRADWLPIPRRSGSSPRHEPALLSPSIRLQRPVVLNGGIDSGRGSTPSRRAARSTDDPRHRRARCAPASPPGSGCAT